MKKTFHDFPLEQLPRERLRKFGVSSLSDAELLAILLRSGGRELNALELSYLLISEFKSIHNLLNTDIDRLRSFKYLGIAKASTLVAVGEISRRSSFIDSSNEVKIENPKQVFDLMMPTIKGKRKEYLYLLNLTSTNKLISTSLLSIGSPTQTIADSKDILRTALIKDAANVILVHNHPSETLDPSKEDIQLTKEISHGCVHVGLNFLDHVILTSSGYYSFKVSGLLDFKHRKEVNK